MYKEKIYIIIYNQENYGDYFLVEEIIQRNYENYKLFSKIWLIKTEQNSNQIWNILAGKFNGYNNLLIAELGQDFQGWLPKEAWDWINSNLSMR